jgi:hypothetical protein
MIDFLKSIGINIGLTIAGFAGALLLAPRMKNWKLQLVAVLSGTLSATYIAPVIIGILNISAPNIEYGLAFIVGFSGVKITEVLETKVLKLLKSTPAEPKP